MMKFHHYQQPQQHPPHHHHPNEINHSMSGINPFMPNRSDQMRQ